MVKIKRSMWEKNFELSFEKDDIFWRKDFWESLKNLLSNSSDEWLSIWINAPWGEWKTHFLIMFKNLLDSTEFKSIYFDSFENDFHEDPLIPLVWEIHKNYPHSKKFLEKGKNVIKWILPLSLKIWARVFMWWDIKWVEDKLEELIEGDISEKIWDALDEYVKKDNLIKDFKSSLEELAREKPLVFIIDISI